MIVIIKKTNRNIYAIVKDERGVVGCISTLTKHIRNALVKDRKKTNSWEAYRMVIDSLKIYMKLSPCLRITTKHQYRGKIKRLIDYVNIQNNKRKEDIIR
ncbi:hypothetical protein [Candidatus Vidania fulgoroideorum]